MPDSGLSTQGALEAQPPMSVRRLQNYLYCPRQFYPPSRLRVFA